MSDQGSCVIYDNEIINHKLKPELAIRMLLLDKGCPLVGKISPQLNPEYEYETFQDPFRQCSVYRWRRRSDA